MTSLVELSVEDSVAIVRLNRPDVRNAINDEMRAQFVAALDRAGNDEAVRAVVLTGNGKSFCSGGDISGMRDRLQAPSGKVAFNGWRRQQQTHKSVAALHGMGKVTIAAVNGAAAGLGCDMALACDFIVASEDAVPCSSGGGFMLAEQGDCAYLEGLRKPMQFRQRRCGSGSGKPIVLSKSGDRSPASVGKLAYRGAGRIGRRLRCTVQATRHHQGLQFSDLLDIPLALSSGRRLKGRVLPW